ELLGFVLLQSPRAPRGVDQEDRDLLATVGRQAAAFLAEQRARRALEDARALDLFNRRVAFVVHDLKTMISQLSMLLANADKHGRNPAFQRDLLISVRESVGSMNRLLQEIKAARDGKADSGTLDLVRLVRGLVQQRVPGRPEITLQCLAPRLEIVADEA